ncbi:MAG: glycosyltransferase, partial [Enterococcus sp.]
MIFITLGSQKFQFNRLLRYVDNLIEKGKIEDKVFAQTGFSDYKPSYFDYKEYLCREEFLEHIARASLIITHGGTGVIVTALKANKKVIAIPRQVKYKEHVDDHQN